MTRELRIEYTKTEDGVSIAWTSVWPGAAAHHVASQASTATSRSVFFRASAWADHVGGRRDARCHRYPYDCRGSGSSDRQVVPDFRAGGPIRDLEGRDRQAVELETPSLLVRIGSLGGVASRLRAQVALTT